MLNHKQVINKLSLMAEHNKKYRQCKIYSGNFKC